MEIEISNTKVKIDYELMVSIENLYKETGYFVNLKTGFLININNGLVTNCLRVENHPSITEDEIKNYIETNWPREDLTPMQVKNAVEHAIIHLVDIRVTNDKNLIAKFRQYFFDEKDK